MLSIDSIRDPQTIPYLQSSGLFNVISKLELYQDVILAYDQDQDYRLQYLVRHIKVHNMETGLFLAYETDGQVTLIWKNILAADFVQGKSIQILDQHATHPDDNHDFWFIAHSITLDDLHQLNIKNKIKKSVGFQFSDN